MDNTKTVGKRFKLEDELRSMIVSGALLPGSRVSSRRELALHNDVSPVTAQQALDTLARDGFICQRRGAGSFVAEHPPHLTTYALAFPTGVNDLDYWTRFTVALCNEANRLETQRPCKIISYYGVDNDRDVEVRSRLEDDVLHHRIAGVILTRLPFCLGQSPILTHPGMPRVIFVSQPQSGLPTVFVDYKDFAHKALDHLTAQGRKKIAVLGDSAGILAIEALTAEMLRRGLEVRPYWIQKAAHYPPEAARDQVHLMARLAHEEGIDGLVIADDNLVDAATAGLLAAGAEVPSRLEVVAFANFPGTSVPSLPLTRIGFDVSQILKTCMGLIDAQRRGEKVKDLTLIPARFENL